jgi:hypothetical protein
MQAQGIQDKAFSKNQSLLQKISLLVNSYFQPFKLIIYYDYH